VKALKLEAYRPHLLQMLTEDDFDRRIELTEWFFIRCEAEPDFPRRILCTDEASFKLNGRINRHNNVYWSDSNPHEVIQEELNVPGITVWAGIWSGGIVGPYFFAFISFFCTSFFFHSSVNSVFLPPFPLFLSFFQTWRRVMMACFVCAGTRSCDNTVFRIAAAQTAL
jgi:hypothetical protein